jgi:hypothetical protein
MSNETAILLGTVLTGGLGVAIFNHFAGQKKTATDINKESMETAILAVQGFQSELTRMHKEIADLREDVDVLYGILLEKSIAIPKLKTK